MSFYRRRSAQSLSSEGSGYFTPDELPDVELLEAAPVVSRQRSVRFNSEIAAIDQGSPRRRTNDSANSFLVRIPQNNDPTPGNDDDGSPIANSQGFIRFVLEISPFSRGYHLDTNEPANSIVVPVPPNNDPAPENDGYRSPVANTQRSIRFNSEISAISQDSQLETNEFSDSLAVLVPPIVPSRNDLSPENDENDDNYDNDEDGGDTVEDKNASSSPAPDGRKRFVLKRLVRGNNLITKCFHRMPRCHACVCGIILPLWFIIFLSLCGGYFLAGFENGIELDANDAAMRNRLILSSYEKALQDTIALLPTVCYSLFTNNLPATAVINVLDELNGLVNTEGNSSIFTEGYAQNITGDYAQNIIGDYAQNVTGTLEFVLTSEDGLKEFGSYVQECASIANNYTGNLREMWFLNSSIEDGGNINLTFNWNKCVNDSEFESSFWDGLSLPSWEKIYAARPENQSKVYRNTWKTDQYELEVKYYEEYLNSNYSYFDAQRQAFKSSLYEATGRDKCSKNIAATAWFWFVVMTTVGYGNQAPASTGGRLMVYILGFTSILVFGSTLATSGTIVSLVVNDFAARLRLRWLNIKWVAMVMWGILWLLWMTAMMGYFYWFNKVRLDSIVLLEDAYWWAFISTTTIGLGDFYPAPAVIFLSDLLVMSFGFLIGFTLLSTFLVEVGQLLENNSTYISTDLDMRLHDTGLFPSWCPCCLNLAGPREMSFDAVVMENTIHPDGENFKNEAAEKGTAKD